MIAFAKPRGTSTPRSADELLAEFRSTGAQAPFEELVRRYAAMVFSECYAVTRSRHDAEDAAQATFLTLAIQARTGEEIRYLGPWLQRVARRVALDQEKAKRRRRRREDNHHTVNGSTGHATPHRESLDQLELRHIISEELQTLPPKYRMPLVLHYFGGLTREQMASELNCKPATLGVRLFRAREMLGKRLAKRGVVLPAVALPIAIAMVVREGVQNNGVLAMVASAQQIAAAAVGLAAAPAFPSAGPVSPGVSGVALAMADEAARKLVLRRVRSIIAAAAIGASALAAGGAEIIHRIHDGSLRFNSLFDLPTFFRGLTTPGLPPLRVQADPVGDGSQLASPANPPMPFDFGPGTTPDFAPLNLHPGATYAAGPASTTLPPQIGVQSPVVPLASLASAGPAKAPSATSPVAPPVPPLPSPDTTPQKLTATDLALLTSGATVSAHKPASPADVPAGFSGLSLPAPGALADLSPRYTSFAPAAPVSRAGTLTAQLSIKPVAASATKTALSSARSPVSATPTLSVSADGSVLSGFGRPAFQGTLDQSGIVIAEGDGQPRTLDLSGFTTIANAVPNPPTALNGYYARSQAQLAFPPQAVPSSAGPTATLTFGDDPQAPDEKLDLVGAVRLKLHNPLASSPTTAAPPSSPAASPPSSPSPTLSGPSLSVRVALLSADRPEIPAVPQGLSTLSLWSISFPAGLGFNSFDFLTRYALPGADSAAATAGLSVYYLGNTGWDRAVSTLDVSSRRITATGVPRTSLVALLVNADRSKLPLLTLQDLLSLSSPTLSPPSPLSASDADDAVSEVSAFASSPRPRASTSARRNPVPPIPSLAPLGHDPALLSAAFASPPIASALSTSALSTFPPSDLPPDTTSHPAFLRFAFFPAGSAASFNSSPSPLDITIVPEPGPVALLLPAGLILLRRRRP